jgi:serine/threonine protein kinase
MAELGLVCGPADPLPEAAQSYRLIERLGSGGQADVYKAVRLSGGVSSAPVSVKVFRPEKQRTLEAQFRSWDKGDAVLMDLLSRGVPGICRRIDAFYGPPPHRPGAARAEHLVPYQVLEYLPGNDLRELLPRKDRPRIDAVAVLHVIAKVLDAMHRPHSNEIHPAVHLDIKPSNVIVSPSGEAKVIDFTGARYAAPSHITTIAYTPEAAGPEARGGRVGPSYDVHGFGAVAFFLVTGIQPRGDTTQTTSATTPGEAVLRRHPVLDADPRLRAHLLAPLADAPRDRPPTVALPDWIDELASIMQASRAPGLGVDWKSSRVVSAATATRKVPVQAHGLGEPDTIAHHKPPADPTTVASASPTSADLPQTRKVAKAASGAGQPARPGSGTVTATASVSPAAPTSGAGLYGRGVAQPVRPQRAAPQSDTAHTPRPPEAPAEPPRPWGGTDGKFNTLMSGSELSVVGALFAFVCWGIWAIANWRDSGIGIHIFTFVLVLVVAAGVFAMARLLGTLVIVRLLKRTRRTARLSHLATGIFLVLAGIDFLKGVAFLVDFWAWLGEWF